jgi:chorismate synthase
VIGCHLGRNFQVTVAGGSYQEGMTAVVQGHPPGMLLTEQEIYGDLLLRKPGADELSSPRKEPDLPIIYSGLNVADTIVGAKNKDRTNGTPLSILIPNLDRHFVHIKQYQDTNRTPRPGHASYASFIKYGPDDDAIGAGIFSGRYTSTIVAAGYVAKKILKKCGIEVFSYVKELASVRCPDVAHGIALTYVDAYKQMRSEKRKVIFDSNNAGGITGGLTTGQPIVVKLAVKPTPTIDKPQHTIDKYTLLNKELAAITRRDPTIVARIWPVAENYTAIVILDHLMAHYGYQMVKTRSI